MRFGWRWDADGAFVFPRFCSTIIYSDAVSPHAMAQRFLKHRDRLSRELDDTSGVETLHGLRAGGALSMALDGASLQEICLQGFWRSPKTALHYIGLLELIVGEEFIAAVQQSKGTRIPAAQLTPKQITGTAIFLQ